MDKPLSWKELSETKGITMVHLNARSLVNHFDEIKFLLSVYPQKLVLIRPGLYLAPPNSEVYPTVITRVINALFQLVENPGN